MNANLAALPAIDGTVVAAVVVLAVLFGLGARCVIRFAATRSAAQPLMFDVAAERVVIGTVIARPDTFAVVCSLSPDDFAEPGHRALWAAISDHLDIDAVRAAVTAAGLEAVTALPTDETIASLSSVAVTVDGPLTFDGDAIDADIHDSCVAAAAETTDALFDAGGILAGCADDRGRLSGTGTVVDTGDRDEPLRRVVADVPSARARMTTMLLVAAGALTPLFALHAVGGPDLAWVLAVAAIAALSLLSCVVALVDLDTFYLDTPTFVPGAAVCWALTAASLAADGDIGRIWSGAAIVAGIAIVFYVSNLGYRAVRGIDGMGMGDTMIVVATAGIPAAFCGSVAVGFWSLMFGMIVAIVVHVVANRGSLNDPRVPFAFGPYLAVGWPIAWAGAIVFPGLG